MISKSARQTRDIAKDLATEIANKKRPTILALSGDLGAGKTTFTQSFAKAFGVKKRILSPTFLIMKRFPLTQGNFENLYHIDAYRVSAADLGRLGIQDVFKGQNIFFI